MMQRKLTLAVVVLAVFVLCPMMASASEVATNECMVDRYDRLQSASFDSLNCTANDVQITSYQLISFNGVPTDSATCTDGDTITVGLQSTIVTTAATRYNIGMFLSMDGGTPNALGGSCFIDFLHTASTTNADLDFTDGFGPFYNAEDPYNVCGDTRAADGAVQYILNPVTSTSYAEITIKCQDTDSNGTADVGTCTVWENQTEACSGVDDVTARTSAKCNCSNVNVAGLIWQPSTPPPPATIALTGVVFYDANANGVLDQGEINITGWKVTDGTDSQFSTSTGYSFTVDSDSGDYTISEVPVIELNPVGPWYVTTATSGTVTAGETDIAGPNFGAVCVGGGNALSLGFWSNKNGQLLFSSVTDIPLLVGLNLVNAKGQAFDPGNYSQLKSWLLNATSTNAAYMLSAQLATMELAVAHNYVSSSATVYAPGATSANALGFTTVGALMAEANTELGAHPLTLSGSAYRGYQTTLQTILNNANNNRSFVQATPCSFTTPY